MRAGQAHAYAIHEVNDTTYADLRRRLAWNRDSESEYLRKHDDGRELLILGTIGFVVEKSIDRGNLPDMPVG